MVIKLSYLLFTVFYKTSIIKYFHRRNIQTAVGPR